MESITMMLPSSVACFDMDARSRPISGGCSFPSKMSISPRKVDSFEDVRMTMKQHLDTRFTEKFLDNEPIDDSKPRYSQHQVRFLIDLVERMLFASASSLEEYSDISTLDERFRYIVTRFIQHKLKARIEHNSRERLLANVFAATETKSKTVASKRISVDLPDVQRSFARLNIQQPTRGTRTTVPTRNKTPICRPGLRTV